MKDVDLSFEQQIRQEVDHVRDGMRKTAMAKSFRSLTILLGKLGIAPDKLIVDWDTKYSLNGAVLPRPPFRSGKSYGLGLAEAVAWTKRYLAARKASTAVAALGSVGVSEDKPSSV
jgi:hypothetical protein